MNTTGCPIVEKGSGFLVSVRFFHLVLLRYFNQGHIFCCVLRPEICFTSLNCICRGSKSTYEHRECVSGC